MKYLLLLALPACLSVPDETKPECSVTSDCDTANGEVCEQGTCWGNPPPGPFSAILSPPSERNNELGGREFEIAEIPADGYLFDIRLEEPAVYAGALRALCPTECGEIALGATIIVTRPSLFVGGPGYRQVVESDSRTGAFSISVPRTRPGDPPYTVTVIPDGRGDQPDDVTTAQLVPPLRTELFVADNVNGKSFELGGFSLRTIGGKIADGNNAGLDKYRVVALGRWDDSSPITEVSTVAYTGPTGEYTLRLSENLPPGSVVEVVAKPYGQQAPTLRLNVALSAQEILNRNLIAPSTTGVVRTPIIVRGTDPSGEVAGIVGARVLVRGEITSMQPGTTSVTYAVEGITGESGMVELDLISGSATLQNSYRISVVPPPGAPVGIVFDKPLAGDPVVRLPNRISVGGRIRDAFGQPLGNVQVTVRPSLRFQWSLAGRAQEFVTAIPASTIVTTPDGDYSVFVDPFLPDEVGDNDVWGFYDITIEESATTPAWALYDFEIERNTDILKHEVDDIVVPDAAHIHGLITDGSGTLIEGAELKLFRAAVGGETQLCGLVQHAPPTCPIPAQLLGRGASSVTGEFRLTLPR